MKIRLHELLVKVDLVEHARPGRVKDQVHIVQTKVSYIMVSPHQVIYHQLVQPPTHILVSPKVMQKPQFPQAPLRQNLHQLPSAVRRTFFVNTLVTFLTAHVSPLCAWRAEETHLSLVTSKGGHTHTLPGRAP